MFDSFWDDNLFYWEILVEEIQEIQGDCKEEEPSEIDQVSTWILILEGKGNSIRVIRDWIYPVCPTSYYDRSGVLGIDWYELVEIKKNKAYYKYMGLRK